MLALEAEVLHAQIVFQPWILGKLVDVDLVVEVVSMDLVLLTQHLCQPLEILFLVEDAIRVVIHLTLLMSAPIVVSDLFSMIHLNCVEGKPGWASRTFLFFFFVFFNLLLLCVCLSTGNVVCQTFWACITKTYAGSNMPMFAKSFYLLRRNL